MAPAPSRRVSHGALLPSNPGGIEPAFQMWLKSSPAQAAPQTPSRAWSKRVLGVQCQPPDRGDNAGWRAFGRVLGASRIFRGATRQRARRPQPGKPVSDRQHWLRASACWHAAPRTACQRGGPCSGSLEAIPKPPSKAETHGDSGLGAVRAPCPDGPPLPSSMGGFWITSRLQTCGRATSGADSTCALLGRRG
jgi:hypothetical protein